jgi:hypothetical protein
VEPTTGGDPNDEFARWLAETARAEQAAAQPPTVAPVPPAAAPPAAVPPSPVPPPPAAAPAPEFFGADQLAAPPTRQYEPQLGGPQVARTSFQPPESAPQYPAGTPAADYVTPTVLPPAAVPVTPTAPAEGAPSWAPGYAAPGSVEPATPVAPPASVPVPPAPSYEAPPATSTPFFPDAAGVPSVPPAAPTYPAPTAAPSTFPPVAPPASFPPPAPPSFETPAAPPAPPSFETPAATAFPPLQPETSAPIASTPVPPTAVLPASVPPASVPPADPFGSLFETSAPGDMAARLAATPPPSASPPPLVSPDTGELPADEDPLKSLFGLETEEQPAIVDAAPPAWETPAAVAAPELPTFSPEPVPPVAPAYTPEPAFAAGVGSEPTFAAAPAPASGAPSSSYALTDPSSAPSDADPTAGTQFFGGGAGEWEEPPNLDRTTVGERIAFVLAFILPPIGLIASIVAAVQSARVRGWVHRFVRAGLVIAIVTTVIAGFAGAYLFKVLEDARKHDAISAASAQFCAAVAADPTLIAPPAFGFPPPGASIPDTVTTFQAYVDKWDALAAVSPSGIRNDVTRVADSAREILDTVTKAHLVDDAQNQAVMSSVAESTNVVGWSEEYCG